VIYVKAIASIHCLHSGARQAELGVEIPPERSRHLWGREGNAIPGVHIANLAEMDEEKYRGLFQSIDTVVHLGYHHPPGGE
jgi:hypothetical protein